MIVTVISLIGLIFAEKRAEQPILSGSFMKRRAFISSVLALFLTQGLMQANMTNAIVFVNYTRPENTAVSGYAISVMYLGMSIGAVLLGPLGDRFEPKSVLSGLPPQKAGAGTGTYGLFRDLAAPFGVAVFVPLFTNRITELVSGVIAAVLFLPKIYNRGDKI